MVLCICIMLSSQATSLSNDKISTIIGTDSANIDQAVATSRTNRFELG